MIEWKIALIRVNTVCLGMLFPNTLGDGDQWCGNSQISNLSRDKSMTIMYLSKEKFTCPIVQISLYLTELKQFTLSKTV